MLLALGILLVFSEPASAQMLQFMQAPGPVKTSVRSSSRFYSDLRQTTLNSMAPLYQNESEVWSAIVQGNFTQIDNAGFLPNEGGVAANQAAIPDHFYNAGLGAQYSKRFDSKRYGLGSFTVSSPSDRPFSTSRVMDYVANFVYSFPVSETSGWMIFLNYSNNRPFLSGVPLPGFAYRYTPSQQFNLTAGFPFVMMTWEFVPRWSLQFFALSVSVVKTELNYRLFGPANVYGALEFIQEVYLRKDRTRSEDRFFYAEKKALLGIRMPLSEVFFADLSLGYSFDRAFFEAKKFSDRDGNQRGLATSGVTAFSLAARF